MRTGIFLAGLLLVSVQANAALTDNGGYTTDTATGLDWLDLTATDGLSYIAAGSLYSGQWRYATNTEVEDLFAKAFDGFYSTVSTPWSGLSRTEDGTYADQLEDTQRFQDLFGITEIFNVTARFNYGLYLDEDNILRAIGTSYDPDYTLYDPGGRTVVYGPEFTDDYSALLTAGDAFYGTLLVRPSEVPLPAAAWLFLSALGGLGIIKRKRQ